MKEYDFLIVGAGLFGSVFAREMTDSGKKCLIIDKRKHTGGNVYSENREGINVHIYGPHIFHTNDKEIWEYVNKFADFNNFVNRPKVNYKGKIYSFPINLMTLYQLWGTDTPTKARERLYQEKLNIKSPKNLEEWILSEVGEEIYKIFIYGYTRKQWGREPKDLPVFIIKRLPIRLNFNDNYFTDKYQGIPIDGYAKMIKNIQDGIEIKLNTDFFQQKEYFENIANTIVFTGRIDEFFNYDLGPLEYRSLKFETEFLDVKDFQGNALINYTEYDIPFTRICEHKHFEFGNQNYTVITKEYPDNWSKEKEPFYPINDIKNNNLYSGYKRKSELLSNYIFGGRLAEYKYYDMHQIIASALVKAKKNKRENKL